MKTEHVMQALRRYATGNGALYFEELRAGAGFGTDSSRRMDAWSIQTAPSRGNERTAYEVKVSRSDFRKDMRSPQKQRPARLFSNRFYYVAPAGMIKPDELPVWAGLLEVLVLDPMLKGARDFDTYLVDKVTAVFRDRAADLAFHGRHSAARRQALWLGKVRRTMSGLRWDMTLGELEQRYATLCFFVVLLELVAASAVGAAYLVRELII